MPKAFDKDDIITERLISIEEYGYYQDLENIFLASSTTICNQDLEFQIFPLFSVYNNTSTMLLSHLWSNKFENSTNQFLLFGLETYKIPTQLDRTTTSCFQHLHIPFLIQLSCHRELHMYQKYSFLYLTTNINIFCSVHSLSFNHF